jgi:methionine sulfoxide reductase heme-binding subunit
MITALTTPLIWYTTRATGTVALLLLSASVVLGILTTTRAQSGPLPRFAVGELHRRVSLVAGAFLVLHVVSAVVDTYVPIGWWSVVAPFTSGYQRLWVGAGTIAFDLLVAVTLSSLARSRISPRAWRLVHWGSYGAWVVAIVHAIEVGTDLRFNYMQVLVGVCIGAVVAAALWRVRAHPYRGGFRTAVPPTSARWPRSRHHGAASSLAREGRGPGEGSS